MTGIGNTCSNRNVSESEDIAHRKTQHLEICTDPESQVESGSTMLDQVRFVHRALPEINESDIDTTLGFLGYQIAMPLFISSMTGGSDRGYQVNKDLARTAQEAAIPVGMGSFRILLRKPEVTDHFLLKGLAPDVPVFGNIGGVQLRAEDIGPIVEIAKRLEVDAMVVHLNPGQELVQPGGDREFAGVLDGIRRLCDFGSLPVIVKETGFGIAPVDVSLLLDAGVSFVNVAGSGGTNWATVEGYRLDETRRPGADALAEWGLPTGPLLAALRDHDGRILASGGIRSGMDVAKSVALGAVAAGTALPFIRAVSQNGVEGGIRLVEQIESVLRTVMVLTGCSNLAELHNAPLIQSQQFCDTVESLQHRPD